MHTSGNSWLLVFFLLISTCFIITYGGRGGGGRGGSRGGSSSRSRPSSTRYRPATSRPAQRPATSRPAPAPTQKPAPRPTQRPQPPSPKPPSVTPKPAAPEAPVVAKQPASNPNFKESNPVQGSSDKQPASNPNYKPDSNAPGGPPPPYSPGGQPAPSAPLGPPPPYGSAGQRPPYPVQPGGQPPPYSGPPGRPPAYPGLPTHPGSAPYPVQPGSPGGYPQQPGVIRPYPVQPGYPGSYQQQPGVNRPYPVQPGFYQPGVNRPHSQQPLGSNVWQPQSGMPAPAYMNRGGLPTGANMYSEPHKKKGFLGSLMSVGGSKANKPNKNKYYGSQPGPYGAAALGGAGMGYMGGRGGGFGGGYGKSAAMNTIMPYGARKAGSSFKPKLGFMALGAGMIALPLLMSHYHSGHYGYGMYPRHAHYYDIYDEDYLGRCRRPIRKENYAELKCKATYKAIECGAKCEEGYTFPDNTTIQYNKCWHVSGVWRPAKNLPDCSPVCEEDCLNGGNCIRPGFCSCPAEYRGNRCQFRKLNFLNCEARLLTKGEKVGWVCNHTKNETVCKIRCTEPGQFETPAADEYKCTPDGKWTPDSIPHCIVKDKEKDVPSSSS